jgi:hypothetical protein
MLEIVISFLGLTLLWAYLYAKSDPTTLSGIVFRVLFLGLMLFTIYELLSFLVIYAENNNLPENVTNLVVVYMNVMNYIIFLIFALIALFAVFNIFLPLFKKKEE